MSIKFHCEHCGKAISAPEGGGGKRGRCPACKKVVYVPSGEAGEIDLAPLDEAEERRRRRLIEKDLAAEHDLLIARRRGENAPPESPEEIVEDKHAEGGVLLPELPEAAVSAQRQPEWRDLVVGYLANMAAGRLEEANAIVGRLRADPAAAKQAVEQVLGDPVRDKRIAQVPGPVIAGFVKQLHSALK